jgi:uncharacterized protein YbaP (TraB family)
MKKFLLVGCSFCLITAAIAQDNRPKTPNANGSNGNAAPAAASMAPLENTLLWEISGNGLTNSSYLFGTMHILCAEDARLSDNLKRIIKEADLIYFEIDMDNMMEMLGALKYLKMNGNKKLSDLLTPEEYQRVKNYFASNKSPMPFALMESFKPFFISSLISEQKMDCAVKEGMEQAIIKESKQYNKEIKGLESVAFQASVFDSIPYEQQAKELVKSIDSLDKNSALAQELLNVYKSQDLKKIEELTSREEGGISPFMDLLLYNRNTDWAQKMNGIMQSKNVLFAVGAAHLPGEKGVINLLRKSGFSVKPVSNTFTRLQ